MHFGAESLQLLFGFDGKVFGVIREDVLLAFNEDDAGLGGIDMAEVAAHVVAGDVADGSGEFDAGGTAADDDEVERVMGSGLEHFPLGEFEGEKDAATNFDGVLNGLESWRQWFPLVMAEVGVGRAGGEDEVVVRHFRAAAKANAPTLAIEGDRFIHKHLGVGAVAKDGAEGGGNFAGRKDSEADLIEEGLEGEVIAAVDDGYIDRHLCQSFGGVGSCEAAADDQDAGAAVYLVSGHFVRRASARNDAAGGKTMESVGQCGVAGHGGRSSRSWMRGRRGRLVGRIFCSALSEAGFLHRLAEILAIHLDGHAHL